MSHQIPYSNTKLDKAMTPEQFTQVVEAILAGKYSWACVLILRFAGYNPLHYIPYRTYNRLLKENCLVATNQRKTNSTNVDELVATKCDRPSSPKPLSAIVDLDYLEVASEPQVQVRGGNLDFFWFHSNPKNKNQLLKNLPKWQHDQI